MNKTLIQQRFAKNLECYNKNAKIQKLMAEKLLTFLDNSYYKDILEIGCGTGLLTKLAISKFKFDTYTANDIVKECEKYISAISDKINFIEADIEEIIKSSDKKYDLIISNATFQWIDNFESFINTLYSKLNPNGVLLFSTFGTQNFQEISQITGETLPYKSKKQYIEIFQSKKTEIIENIEILEFDTPKDVLKHIKYTGVNAIKSDRWTKGDMYAFETKYNNLYPQKTLLTYNPIYIKIIK